MGYGYKEQINDDKNDTVFYEIKRFLDLVSTNNPTILELLNTPEDCILYKHPLIGEILQHRDKFITKKCSNSFAGYAIQQIKKAKGQDKKQNWEKDKVTRKDVLDFCYVIEGEKSIPWKAWNLGKYEERFCGVVNVPNARDVYAVYFDNIAFSCFSSKLPQNDTYYNFEARKEANLTQEQLAEKTGTKKSYISKIENAKGNIQFSTLIKIFEVGLNKRIGLTFL